MTNAERRSYTAVVLSSDEERELARKRVLGLTAFTGGEPDKAKFHDAHMILKALFLDWKQPTNNLTLTNPYSAERARQRRRVLRDI